MEIVSVITIIIATTISLFNLHYIKKNKALCNELARFLDNKEVEKIVRDYIDNACMTYQLNSHQMEIRFNEDCIKNIDL